jgi:hypothetical protein
MSALPDPRSPRDFPAPPLRAVGERDGEAAPRSAGRAAPDAADQGRLSSGRGAVKALAPRARASKQSLSDSLAPRASGEALYVDSASLRALRVTAPRQGSVARDGGAGGEVFTTAASSAAWPFELHTTYLRSAPRASAGISRGAPAARRRPVIPRVGLGRVGPSSARTQVAAFAGCKGKTEDTAMRSVSAAARPARGIAGRRPYATQIIRPAREAGLQEEN